MFKARWKKLLDDMKRAEVSNIALMPGPNMFYMTGLSMGLSERPILLVASFDGGAVFIMPEFEKQKGERVANRLQDEGVPVEFSFHSYSDEEGPESAFKQAFKSKSGMWGLEHVRFRMLEYALMKKVTGGFSWIDAGEIMKGSRMVKDETELLNMQEAARLADLGVGLARNLIAPGRRAVEITFEIERRLKSEGAQKVSQAMATGPDTAIPHAGTTSRIIQSGDLVWLDLCVNVKGYWSDITRTFAVGEISQELRRIYEIVLMAQERARLHVKPGMSGADVDALARDVIDDHGYGDWFTHRTGHGLGLEVHEEPYIVASNKAPLPVGSTFTIEPGIYLPGKGGVRIEDDVVLTLSGAKSLTVYPRNLLKD